MSDWDFIIVGQGLAGTTLAWHLHWRNSRVLLIDRDDDITSSKIAAGLITPITGQRLVKTWRFDELWETAQLFYRRAERLTGTRFFTPNSQVRLFANEKERTRFAERSFHADEIDQPDTLVNRDWFDDSLGGFQMRHFAQLNVPSYLAASRRYFENLGAWINADLSPNDDIQIQAAGVELARQKVRARRLIFCQGFAARENPWFSQIQFDATRGEILTVRIPGLCETRIVNRGVWLAPLGDGLFRVGSTYDWDDLTSGPTEAGRAAIVERLASFLRLPFEVIDHQAAVRPIVIGRHPIVGLHPAHPQIGIFNGLGSKGSLQAPRLAELFASHLLDEDSSALDDEINVAKRFAIETLTPTPTIESNPRKLRLTELAHQQVAAVLKPGELAIDATAGNGHDTLFLVAQVGQTGRVIAIDIQPAAIQRTAERLQEQGFSNVTLIQRCHGDLLEIVPASDHGRVGAVMFNLGYLPHGDKSVMTRTGTSLLAIAAALEIVRPSGIVSILAYPGHSGGDDESSAVVQFVSSLDVSKFTVSKTQATSDATSPILIQVSSKR